jgi:hypothetical protein
MVLYFQLLQEGQYGRFLAGANISEVCLQNLNATIRAAIITRETWALRCKIYIIIYKD